MSFRADFHAYVRDLLDLPVTPVRLPLRPNMPALDHLVISGTTIPTHSGPAGLVTKRVQWDVWAGNDVEVDDISERLRRELDGFRGSMGDTTVASCFYDGEQDIDEGKPDDKVRLYHRAIDFLITYHDTPAAEAS